MSLPVIFDSMEKVLEEIQVNEILQTNIITRQYGLMLTAEDAKEMIEVRNHVLQSCGRIELGTEVTRKFIQSFCTSSFINQEEYALTLNALHEIFYYMKNETGDKIGDDELIITIKDLYENSCGGSVDLLMGRLDEFAENLRRRNQIADCLR